MNEERRLRIELLIYRTIHLFEKYGTDAVVLAAKELANDPDLQGMD